VTVWHVMGLLIASGLQAAALFTGHPEAVKDLVNIMVAGVLGNAMGGGGRHVGQRKGGPDGGR